MKNSQRTLAHSCLFIVSASLMLIAVAASAQKVVPPVSFPENPPVGDRLQICLLYPDTAQLPIGLYCIAYINDTLDDPRAQEIFLQKTANSYTGSIATYNGVRSVLCVFLDSAGNVYNNDGKGYWTPMWKAGNIVEGALAGIAEMYAGAWPPDHAYKLRKQPEIAHELYEREFLAHPQLKRKFFRYYLGTFDLNDTAQRVAFRRELDLYAALPDLTEWELAREVGKYYTALGED